MTLRHPWSALVLLLCLTIPTSHMQASWAIPKRMFTLTLAAGTVYYTWIATKKPLTEDQLKPINSWTDYFLNAQREIKDPTVFTLSPEKDGIYTGKALKYPAHGAGEIITYGEKMAKYGIPALFVLLTTKKMIDEKGIPLLILLDLYPTA